MMTASSNNAVPSPHSHPGMIQQQQQQQQQVSVGPSVSNSITRYMMAQSPQAGAYRPQMSPMNMMSMKA